MIKAVYFSQLSVIKLPYIEYHFHLVNTDPAIFNWKPTGSNYMGPSASGYRTTQ